MHDDSKFFGGCDAMLLGEWFQTFQRKVKPSFSRVKWTKKCPNRLQSGDIWARSDQLIAEWKGWEASMKVWKWQDVRTQEAVGRVLPDHQLVTKWGTIVVRTMEWGTDERKSGNMLYGQQFPPHSGSHTAAQP